MMTQANTRYLVEHRVLPDALYNNGAALLRTLMTDEGRAMGKIYNHTSKECKLPACPYAETDFTLKFREYVKKSSSVLIVGIQMPQPERVPLCRAVYLCYGLKELDTLYITSELYDDGHYGLCVRTKNNERLTYSYTSKDEFDAVAKTYWDFTCGGGRELITHLRMTVPRKRA